jgi:hypothetical protein
LVGGTFAQTLVLAAGLLAAASAPAANIYWVSFHPAADSPATDAATAGFTQASDVGYTQLLEANGHTVTRYVTTGTPDKGLLSGADLVIISRSVPSGDYQDLAEATAWNGVTAPTMILGGYILRKSRLGYTAGETIPDTAGTVTLAVRDPSHPIFEGIALDAAKVMVNPYANPVSFNGTPQRGISVNTDAVAGGGTILATIGTAGDPAAGGMVIGEWPAAARMGNGGADTLGGPRLVFLTGSREASGLTSQGSGIFDLTEDGATLFLNAVNYLSGFVDATPPALVEAKGRPSLDTVVLTFSEPLEPTGAVELGNYIVAGPGGELALISAVLSTDARQVIITTDPQTAGDEYTVTVNNVADLMGNPIAPDSVAKFRAGGMLLQTEAGFVIWEAEDFDRNLDGRWLIDTTRGTPSGGASVVNPNGYGGTAQGTVLEYDIRFVKTGTHIIWYRASSDSGTDDSAFLRLDGVEPANRPGDQAAMTGFSGALDYVWRSDSYTGADPMSFEITEPGQHTIGLARREDGAFFDKFIITTDPTFVPTGFGPPNTPREGEAGPPPAQITITLQPVDVTVGENGRVTFTTAATSDDPLLAYQWQRKVDNAFENIPGAVVSNLTINPATLDWNGAIVRARVVVAGNEAYTQEAKVTVIPDTIAPALLGANGDALRSRAILRFSEPLDVVTAGDLASYAISGPEGPLDVTSVTYTPGSRTVILGTGAQIVGYKYTVNVNGIADLAATPNLLAPSVVRFYSLGARLAQGDDGLVVYEAENYDTLIGSLWAEDALSGTPSGGLSMHVPDNVNDGRLTDQLEYQITFTQPGTQYIWWRARADNDAADSGWLHVNGDLPATRTAGNSASMSGFNTGPTVDFVWSNDSQDGPDPMTFEIETPGLNTIGLGSREDGAYFDKFVITTDPNFIPAVGYGAFGPPETREGQPPLPTLAITSPATLTEFAPGTNVQFTVSILATPRVVSVVEYYAGGTKIGQATNSPFSFTWQGVPIGVHNVTALLRDDVGDSVQSAVVTVVARGTNDVLLLVGNPDLSAAPGDAAIRDRLAAFGFTVVVVDDGACTSLDAIGKRLIVDSSTVGSGSIGTKFRDAAVPVVSWEQANQDDFGMTLNTDGVDRGSLAAQTQVELLATTHPMAAGFAPGPLTIATAPTDYSWGLPNENAVRIATVVGNPAQVLIYGYEAGAIMADGLAAPARRVQVFLTDTAFTQLNAEGVALIDAALSWAVDEKLVIPGNEITITGAVAGPGGLTLTWQGGRGPYTIRTRADLSAPWVDLLTTSQTSQTVPMGGASAFYQIKAP